MCDPNFFDSSRQGQQRAVRNSSQRRKARQQIILKMANEVPTRGCAVALLSSALSCPSPQACSTAYRNAAGSEHVSWSATSRPGSNCQAPLQLLRDENLVSVFLCSIILYPSPHIPLRPNHPSTLIALAMLIPYPICQTKQKGIAKARERLSCDLSVGCDFVSP